jgi:sterol desaturase/sphingolipid hydroxylase (fatty acid hydroxylase superfamily)
MNARLLRLFRLSRREYFADFFITPPITLILAGTSLWRGVDLRWLSLFAAGWLAWTLYEYAAHVASHHLPLLRDLHALHHRDQRDYIAVHPAITLALYALVWLAIGFTATPAAVGFSTGYVVYSALHTAFHYARIVPGHPLYAARRRHALHHICDGCCFGVSTPFWDWIFRTGTAAIKS